MKIEKFIKKYHEDGFVFPIEIFSEKEALDFRDQLENIERNYKHNSSLPLPLNAYKRINSQCVIPLSTKIALNKNLLDVVEKIIGPNILLWSVEFFIKEPESKSIVSMHQDLTYWGFDDNEKQVSAWIALSNADEISGCMQMIPGSHKKGFYFIPVTFQALCRCTNVF